MDYGSIKLPEKESFYNTESLYNFKYEFDQISHLGILIVWSEENIEGLYSHLNTVDMSQKNKEFEELILT